MLRLPGIPAIFKSTRCVAASTVVLIAGQASAQGLSEINEGPVSFYGQLSPTYLGVDDGVESYDNLADNARSNSRVGFNIDRTLAAGDLRFNFETSLGAPQTASFSQTDDPVWEWEETDIRKLELIWSGESGALLVGQGSMASDNTADIDLSGTTMASSVTTADSAGNYAFRTDTGALSPVNIGSAFATFDGPRRFRIRVDTPRVFGISDGGGLKAAVAYGENLLDDSDDAIYYDIGLFYQEELGNLQMQGGANYAWKDDDDVTESYAGSFSVLHMPSGLNATVAAGGAVDGGHYAYGKLGWIADVWSGGSTAVSADYYNGQDLTIDGSTSEAWGVQVAQYVDRLSLQVYAGWSRVAYDDSAAAYRDIDTTLAGVRWTF